MDDGYAFWGWEEKKKLEVVASLWLINRYSLPMYVTHFFFSPCDLSFKAKSKMQAWYSY
jgi:hypothetical protein